MTILPYKRYCKQSFLIKGFYLDREAFYLLMAIAVAGTCLVCLLFVICCYCLKERNVHEDAKIYYYRNIQEDGMMINNQLHDQVIVEHSDEMTETDRILLLKERVNEIDEAAQE